MSGSLVFFLLEPLRDPTLVAGDHDSSTTRRFQAQDEVGIRGEDESTPRRLFKLLSPDLHGFDLPDLTYGSLPQDPRRLNKRSERVPFHLHSPHGLQPRAAG